VLLESAFTTPETLGRTQLFARRLGGIQPNPGCALDMPRAGTPEYDLLCEQRRTARREVMIKEAWGDDLPGSGPWLKHLLVQQHARALTLTSNPNPNPNPDPNPNSDPDSISDPDPDSNSDPDPEPNQLQQHALVKLRQSSAGPPFALMPWLAPMHGAAQRSDDQVGAYKL